MRIWKGRPVKALTRITYSSGGRNCYGKITCRHKGGRSAINYRLLDTNREQYTNHVARLLRVEKDPRRTAAINLFMYENGILTYNIATQGLKISSFILNGPLAEPTSGSAMALANVPPGTLICCLQFFPRTRSHVAMAGGSFAQLLRRVDDRYSLVKLPSGERRFFSSAIWAVVGVPISVGEFSTPISSKAGRNRWLGIRPSVRGVAMNPVDHPHGGGQGKTSGGRPSVSPWGRLTKGRVTKPLRFQSSLVYKSRKLFR
jgi:large subunit ribosomal protein L2